MRMKILSTTALAMALTVGVVGSSMIAAPAIAKEKAPAEKPMQLSKPVRDALSAAQTALKANDAATAAAKVAEAQAAVKTDDDKFFTASILLEVSKLTNDPKQQQAAIDGLLATTRLTPEQRAQMLVITGQRATQAGDYARADQVLTEALKINPNNNDAYALLAESRVKAGKPQEAIAMFQQAMANAKSSGQKLPPEWYGRAVNIAFTAKLPAQTEAITQEWLTVYPTKDNWRDSIVTWRDLHPVDTETQIDLFRLQRAANALKGQGDYGEYAYAVYSKNPGEAKTVLDEGVRAGALNLASNKGLGEINTVVAQRIPADKASLGKVATDAKGAKGTARLAVNVGDAYLGYGQYAQAAEMYRLALTKGGADANLVNTRLGQALYQSGDKAGASEAFAKVTGPRAPIAKYWSILIAQGAPA